MNSSIKCAKDDLVNSNLRDEDRLAAAQTLAFDLSQEGRDTLFEVLPKVTASEWLIRAIVEIIAELDDPRVSECLLGFIKHPSSSVQQAALYGLAQRQHPGCYSLIDDYLVKHTQDYERTIGAKAAGLTRDVRTLPSLKHALTLSPTTGEEIAQAMNQIRREHPETTNEIVASLSEYLLSVNLYCMACLKVLQEIAQTIPVKALKEWQKAVRDQLVEQFSSGDEEKHIEAMYTLYNFNDYMDETVTADPLVRDYGIPVLVRQLREYLEANQSNEEIPGRGLPVIADSRITDDLIQMIECGPTVYERYHVFYNLGAFGTAQAVPVLLEQLAHQENQQREFAQRALRIFALQERSPEDREAALISIRKALTDTRLVEGDTRICDVAERLRKDLEGHGTHIEV